MAKAREYFRKGTHALKSQDSSQALTLFAKAHFLTPPTVLIWLRMNWPVSNGSAT